MTIDNALTKAKWTEDTTNTDTRFEAYRAEVDGITFVACVWGDDCDTGCDGAAIVPGGVMRFTHPQRHMILNAIKETARGGR